jgi:hypothetical protein
MARCGCNNAASTTCDAIMSCIADNLGRGLEFNEETGQIDLRLSTDPDNVAAIGTDDGFYAPAVTGPGDMVWLRTVDTLPEEAINAASASNLAGPATAPQLIEYSIANGIDIYSVPIYAVADDTVFEGFSGISTSVATYTDNPGAIHNRFISSLTMQHMEYDAGTRVNPTGRNSNAPVSLLTPDGGWGGFYAPVYKTRTINEMLRQIRGRMVVDLLIQRATIPEDRIEASIIATVAAVVQAGAQDWCIIEVPSQLEDDTRAPIDDWVAIVTDAGITAAVNCTAENLMPSPFTPAEIVASGATWVSVVNQSRPDGITDARITALVGAGLEVMVTTSARQYWTTQVFGLGARAVRSPDAVYMRGVRGEPGDLNYRDAKIVGLATRTTATGALTPFTDTQTAMWTAGFARADLPGRWFPLNYGWSGSTSMIRNSQLLGTICPVPDPLNYRIEVRVRRDSDADPDNRSTGLFFAVPDDRGVQHLAGSSVNPNADGYIAALNTRTTGTTMILQRVTNGVATTLGSITTGTVTWVANTWITLAVNVTPAGVTFTATNGVLTNSITNADLTWRGAYAYYTWDDQLGPMVHGYDNPLDLVMYEEL